MRKLLIGIVAIIALLALGIKLYIWHKTTTLADNLIALAAPFATISYDGTTSSLWSGRAGVTDITIRPSGMDGEVRIGELSLETGDLSGLLAIAGTLGEGDMPDTLRLHLKQVRADLDILPQERSLEPGFWGLYWELTGRSLGALACGVRDRFSAADLRRMGFSILEFGMHIGYTLDRVAQSVTMQIGGIDQDMSTMELTLTAQMPQGAGVGQLMTAKPQITGAHLRINDRGWNARWREFCAAETQQTEDDFLTAHTSAVRAAFARRGIGISDAMEQHYRALLADNAELDITLRPAQPLNLDSLQFYAPDDLLYYLNPAVTVNAAPVPIEITSLDSATVAKARARKAETTEQATGYKLVPLDTLQQYRGAQVRLTTKNGRVFAGKLVRMDDRVARLERPSFSGGAYEVLVLLWEVEEAAVATQ